MVSKRVLVLGNHASRKLPNILSSLGFAPQVWGSMRHSLDKLRRHKFAAVIVDQKFNRADPLEFILNIRDIDDKVPVVVLGSSKEKRIESEILKQNLTVILDHNNNNGRNFAEKLEQVIKGVEGKNV
jgi:FixJ family two-component response regulator